MKYIDAEKVIVEIERRKKELFEIGGDTFENKWACGSLDSIKAFVISLQQEQPEVDLEKDIHECWRNWLSPSNQNSVDGVLPKEEFAFYARHFFELGLNARKEE